MDGWLEVARIERSRGRIGEVLASAGHPDPGRFSGRRFSLLDKEGVVAEALVERAWLHDGRLVLKFAGVDSISAAEQLRGRILAIPSAERDEPAEGEVYFADLVGCTLWDSARDSNVGTITGWHETAGPVLLEVCSASGAGILVPFAASYAFAIDLPARRVQARLPDGLLELDTP